jgi:LacI family transcriptional regulator
MDQAPTKKPTLRTIAELSGLAIPTVSRALNDAPDIGDKTKARVRAIAREIGYVPNRAGVRLRTGKTNVISLVLGTDNEVTDHTGQLISAIARALRDTRFHMIVTPYFPDEDPMIPVQYIVETGSADAVILNRIEQEDPRVAYLMEREFPFVTFGRTRWRDRHPYFDFDNTYFGRVAAQSLVDSGRRHIALLAPPQRQNYAQDMIAGARGAVAGSAARFDIIPGVTSDDSGEVMRAGLLAFLTARPEVDAFICPSSTSAIATTVVCEGAGRVIGQDIDLFAKETIPFLRSFRPQIRSVVEDVKQAGDFLGRAAIQAIAHPDLPPCQKLVEAATD